MADVPLVMEKMREHLIAAGIVRDPDVDGPLPPLWLAPKNGLNAPNEGSKPSYKAPIQLGALTAPGIPSAAKEGFLVREAVDITLRAMTAPPLILIGGALRRELDDRHHWDMAGLLVEQVQLIVPLQAIVQDEQGFRYRMQFLFTWQDPEWPSERGWG